jgi:PPOX class probable F420-dependent enzyme
VVSFRNLDTLPFWAIELVREARVGHLGVIDDEGAPRVLPVTFALVEGDIWSAVDDKPKRRPEAGLARVRWLQARPSCALTFDRYDDDWSRLAWVQVLGSAAVLAEGAGDALAARYVQYREHPPRGPFLRLTPDRALCWRAI